MIIVRPYPGQDVGAVCRDAYLEFVKANGEEPSAKSKEVQNIEI
jgi:hypothetical protein